MTQTLLSYSAILGLFGLLPALILMTGTWFVARRINNWSIVDVAWPYGFTVLVLASAPCVLASLDGLVSAHLHAVMLILWSLRLGTHIGLRVLGHLGEEDGRYQKMRAQWGTDTPRRMGVFYIQQAVALAILMAPYFASCLEPTAIGLVHGIGAGLVGLALLGETIADAQLAAFKRDPQNRGKVCESGLWSWSRHPNYFCEWVVWVGFALLSWTPTLLGIPGVLCAAAMYHLLNKVTGVAMTEAQLLRSKGAAFADYQRRVPAFWPRPPRR